MKVKNVQVVSLLIIVNVVFRTSFKNSSHDSKTCSCFGTREMSVRDRQTEREGERNADIQWQKGFNVFGSNHYFIGFKSSSV